jgi:hypothetical protein
MAIATAFLSHTLPKNTPKIEFAVLPCFQNNTLDEMINYCLPAYCFFSQIPKSGFVKVYVQITCAHCYLSQH